MTNEDPSDWMWFRALAILDNVEHLRRGVSQSHESRQAHTAWQPSVDMYESDDHLSVVVALPGVSSKSLKVVVKSGILIIAGERQLAVELRHSLVHRMELPQGKFERRLELPPGYYEPGEHKMIDGCLVLQFHKLI